MYLWKMRHDDMVTLVLHVHISGHVPRRVCHQLFSLMGVHDRSICRLLQAGSRLPPKGAYAGVFVLLVICV